GVNPFPALRVINPLGIDARLCSNDVGPFPQRPTHSIVPDLLGQQLELPDDVVQPFDLTVSHLPSSGVPRTNRQRTGRLRSARTRESLPSNVAPCRSAGLRPPAGSIWGEAGLRHRLGRTGRASPRWGSFRPAQGSYPAMTGVRSGTA